ncbi:MAG: hypothetical protein ACK4K0_01765 [Flavobacteriales bacterium]
MLRKHVHIIAVFLLVLGTSCSKHELLEKKEVSLRSSITNPDHDEGFDVDTKSSGSRGEKPDSDSGSGGITDPNHDEDFDNDGTKKKKKRN